MRSAWIPPAVAQAPIVTRRRFTSDDETNVRTVPVGVVTELVEGDVYHWGALMAGALLGSLPVAVMYSFFVEYYVSGLTGAMKE